MKRLIPEFYARDIFSLPISFFKNNNIKYVLSDLDNTLDAANVKEPSQRVIDLVKKLNENDIKIFVISNNNKGRVSRYASKINLEFIYHSGKPFGFKIKKFIKNKGFNPNEVIMIGDQLLTDVKASKRAKLKCCLTDPISQVDQWTTHFNRFIDNRIRNKMKKKNLLNYVKEDE